MTYATTQMMIDRYGEQALIQLTDRGVVPAGIVGTAVVARALADADAVIDGYLAAKYTLPLTETPALVADMAAAITWWKLHPYEPDAKARADYDQALRMLRDVALGTVRLPITGGVDLLGRNSSGAIAVDRDRMLTSDNLTGFI